MKMHLSVLPNFFTVLKNFNQIFNVIVLIWQNNLKAQF